MPKRRATSGDQLTGGTGDVNPQYISGQVVMTAANTTTEVTLATPIVHVGPAGQDHAIVMEIIKIAVQLPITDVQNAAATKYARGIAFSTSPQGSTVPTLNTPHTFFVLNNAIWSAFTAAGTGILDSVDDSQNVFDMTDGAGHGVLVATDNIYVQAHTTAYSGAQTFPFRITYRFKRVSLVEYIGIVQSQQ